MAGANLFKASKAIWIFDLETKEKYVQAVGYRANLTAVIFYMFLRKTSVKTLDFQDKTQDCMGIGQILAQKVYMKILEF